jgi:heme oxygenase
LPVPDRAEAALGALYVIEGSGLGGRVIARHLAENLGLTPDTGGRFYGGLTADGARARWQRLSEVLEQDFSGGQAQKVPDIEDTVVAAMIDAARETFRGLEHWLRRITVVTRSSQELGSQEVAGAVAP